MQPAARPMGWMFETSVLIELTVQRRARLCDKRLGEKRIEKATSKQMERNWNSGPRLWRLVLWWCEPPREWKIETDGSACLVTFEIVSLVWLICTVYLYFWSKKLQFHLKSSAKTLSTTEQTVPFRDGKVPFRSCCRARVLGRLNRGLRRYFPV